MKRSITRWTMALATAGVLGLPVSGYARPAQDPAPQPQQQQPQQPQPQPDKPQPQQPQPAQPQPQPAQPQPTPQPEQPQPQQPTPTPTQPEPTTPQPRASVTPAQTPDQSVSPQEHLRQAQVAADSISATAVPAKNRAALTQLKKHLTTLARTGSETAAGSPAPRTTGAKSTANWGTEVAAIDKIITDIIGSDTAKSTTGGATTPSPTGTSGSKSSTTMIDDGTRAKLMEVRTHITAYAAGMSGTPSSTPRNEASMTEQPSAAATPAAAAQTPSPAQSSPTATPNTPEQTATAAGQPAQNPAPAASAQGQVDTDAIHRHMVAARESLSQLTQLPAAAQLTGDSRTQVAQLITNFNELINAQSNWRASYDKVAGNLTALLGADNTDAEATAGAPTAAAAGATAAPGAVGTSGTATVQLDPAIRAKLVELRQHLSEFEKASGGAK